MGVQFHVYELAEEDADKPRRISWNDWRALDDWLNEEGLDADGRMKRELEYRQVQEVVEETAGVEEMQGATRVSPLPTVNGSAMMFGIETEDADFVVAPVPLQWLLPQSSNGWEVSLTYSIERVGGRNTDGYFKEDEA